MSHTNSSYDYQSDQNSHGEHSSNEEFNPHLKCIQMPYVQCINGHQSLDHISDSIVAANNHYQQPHDISNEQQLSNKEDENSYFSLKRLLNKRHGRCNEDSHLSRRVRDFYKDQDALIDDYERVYGGHNEKLENEIQSLKRQTNILTKVSLGVNIVRIIH